LTVKLR
ncbi:RHS Repeat family protein, partial [Vibrio harveyi]